MSNPRNCATGKRPLSVHYASNHPDTCQKCSECGYWHEIQPKQNPFKAELQALADELAQELPPDYKRACDIRPLDRVKSKDGLFHLVTGFNHHDLTVELLFDDVPPAHFGTNTPLQVDTAESRRNDQALAQAVAGVATENRQAKAAGDDFGMKAFDWLEGAIRLLKNREWAEQFPQNAMLQDMEVQISELVGSATRYTEIQHKFAAAVRTLESLGYSYPVDGAEMWRPARGDKPDFIKWEQGELPDEIPPVGAQVICMYHYQSQVYIGTVLGVGKENIIIEEIMQDGGREEISVGLGELAMVPYNADQFKAAQSLAQRMVGNNRKYGNTELKLALNVVYSDFLNRNSEQ